MIDEKKLDLLRKIKALAERGERGEREAARVQLDRLMEKYNVKEADLSDDVTGMHWFKFSDDFERKLLFQIGYKIAPDRPAYKHKGGRGARTEIGFECTQAEALQIRIEFEFYSRILRDDLDLLYIAFIQKHQIYCDRPPKAEERAPRLTKEQIARMARIMSGLKDETLLKMIE